MNFKWLKKEKYQKRVFITTLILFIIGTLILHLYGPQNTIELVGLTNSYIIAFFMGAFGGSFVLTAGAYYYSIYTISQHGLNPFILGVVGGFGLTVGDSLFYYLGFRGRSIKSKWIGKKVHAFGKWLENKPKFIVLIIAFIYISIIPLPNDLLLISAGFAGYSYRLIIFAVLLGNIFFVTLLGLLGQGLIF
jgi:membrane protein YqaA with SNARE-associated domain